MATTVKYAGSAAAGGGAGTKGDPLTLAEIALFCAAGYELRILNDGTYSPAALTTFTDNGLGNPSAANRALILGWDDTTDTLVDVNNSSTWPVLDGTSVGAGGIISLVESFTTWVGLTFQNSPGFGLSASAPDHGVLAYCQFLDNATTGAILDQHWVVVGCLASGNVIGFSADVYTTWIDCISAGNSTSGWGPSSNYQRRINCVGYDNTTRGADDGFMSIAVGCVFDSCGDGLESSGMQVIRSIISNNTIGLDEDGTNGALSLLNRFYNNGTRVTGTMTVEDTYTTGDPQFTDESTNDFSSGDTSLHALYDALNQNGGADGTQGGGGGGGGLPITAPSGIAR
jgi:hypothetical protein